MAETDGASVAPNLAITALRISEYFIVAAAATMNRATFGLRTICDVDFRPCLSGRNTKASKASEARVRASYSPAEIVTDDSSATVQPHFSQVREIMQRPILGGVPGQPWRASACGLARAGKPVAG